VPETYRHRSVRAATLLEDATVPARADAHRCAVAASRQSIVVGISGGRRNPAAAVAVDGRLLAFCEHERITRIRGGGLRPGDVPQAAIDAVLRSAGQSPAGVTAYVTAEEGLPLSADLPRVRLDHHYGHASTAYLTSAFEKAAVLVCDQHSSPDTSVWVGEGNRVVNQHWPWMGEGFASLFAQCCQVFDLKPDQEDRLEALARLGRPTDADVDRVAKFIAFRDGALVAAPGWKRMVAEWLFDEGPTWSIAHGARVAAAFQSALGGALVALVSDIRRSLGVSDLCLGGGLFYNTFFNTLIAREGTFERVFVPPNPGNAGIAAGAALSVGARPFDARREMASAFLGPHYEPTEIKATLDNCKLTYEYLSDGEVIATCIEALTAGRLVGWFQGRMEWGHRALGNRSILASPLCPYVLDNLNVFLKQREKHRAYALSVCDEDTDRYFTGPARSAWMEYDYALKDPEPFRHVMPPGAATLRVQTLDHSLPLFRDLHQSFKAATGIGALVNTSFNGFSEPIVCSPRDAIRVFYGTGLDMVVIGRFVIRK
jgi:carbamoyltransferase